MKDLQQFFCCCRRKNQITYLSVNNPTTFFIYSGIDSLHIPNSTSLIIVDFGCSYGRKSIQTMKIIIEYLKKTKKFLGSPIIVHNDISANNWTRFCQLLHDDNSYHSLVLCRSFYEQCLPTNSLSIGFSSASLHYLSQVPCNITNHCYFQFAHEHERKLFQNQSKQDFILFIEHRSREMMSGGVLILNIPSTNDEGEMGFNSYFDLLYKCAQLLSLLTSDELLHFTLPFYLRSLAECVDLKLFHRCSLQLIRVECLGLKSPIFDQYQNRQIAHDEWAKSLTMLMRPGSDMALKQALKINGRSNEEIDKISTQFWALYERKVKDEFYDRDVNIYTTYLILKKN